MAKILFIEGDIKMLKLVKRALEMCVCVYTIQHKKVEDFQVRYKTGKCPTGQ